MNKFGAVLIACALAAFPASAADAPKPSPPAEKLIGAWRLLEIRERDSETGAEKPATPASAGGQLIYAANGRLSVQIARVGWEKVLPGGANGFASYFGTWEPVPAEGYVIHHQDGNLNPKQIGQAAKRYYSFDAQGHLALATPPARNAQGRAVSTVFVWERFP
jgi:amidase